MALFDAKAWFRNSIKPYLSIIKSNKQDVLVSATNIKTINSQSLLGAGNIVINSGTLITKDSSVAAQTGFASDTYLAKSYLKFPVAPNVTTVYKLRFDVTKTAAGTAPIIINIRIGTAGTTADTSRIAFTFGAGTAAIDTGVFDIIVSFRTIGAGASAVVQAQAKLTSNLTTTGLSNAVKARVATSAGFDSTVANLGIGASYNGGTSAAHTITLVRAELII